MAPTSTLVTVQYGTGEKGAGVGKDGRRALRQPRGLQLCEDGSLLVADFGNHCVIRFGSSTNDLHGQVVAGEDSKPLLDVDPMKEINKPGPLGPGEGEGFLLKRPIDICENPEGGVLVLDSDMGRVQRFRKDVVGGAETVMPRHPAQQKARFHAEAIKNPRSFMLCADGAMVVCDTWSHRVLRFAAPAVSNAEEPPTVLAGSPNTCGKQADQLAFPSSAALAPDGTLLVADTNNHRVQRFSPGEFCGKTVAGSCEGQHGEGPGELNMPTGICIDPQDGSFLVADRANARVLRFAADSCAGDPGEVIVGPELLERPWGVCLGPNGTVYVSDERRARVLKLEVCGTTGNTAQSKQIMPQTPLVASVANSSPNLQNPTPEAETAAPHAPNTASVETSPIGGNPNMLD